MATHTKTVVVAVCDFCSNSLDEDGNEMHWDTEEEALYWATEGGWHLLDDGRLLCWRRDPVHDWIRESRGLVEPGPDAATWTAAAA